MLTTNETEFQLQKKRKFIRGFLNNIVWVILVLCVIIFSFSIEGFFNLRNYINIIDNSVFLALLAIAEAYCLISGNLDLSIESVAGFTAILSAWLCGASQSGSGLMLNPYAALAISIVVGMSVGFINSFIVYVFKINAFLVTLSTFIIFKGLAVLLTSGTGVSLLPDSFRLVETIQILRIPLIVFIMIVLYVIFYFILESTSLGKHIFVIGGNINTAYNFGINVRNVIFKVFIISGTLAAVTGWLMTAKANGASTTMANGILFEVLAAVVLGGVSLQGGVGSLLGVFAGVLILSFIKSALNILAVSPFITDVIRGLLVLFAILIDSIKRLFK